MDWSVWAISSAAMMGWVVVSHIALWRRLPEAAKPESYVDDNDYSHGAMLQVFHARPLG